MKSLICDINNNHLIIECDEIGTSISKEMDLLNTSYEVSIKLYEKEGHKWVIDWYQSMFSNGDYSNARTYKRDIHIEKIDILIHNCFINSYISEDNSVKIKLIGDYISIGTDSSYKNYYLKYYRDFKINQLIDL